MIALILWPEVLLFTAAPRGHTFFKTHRAELFLADCDARSSTLSRVCVVDVVFVSFW
jgi:hypothetical protein